MTAFIRAINRLSEIVGSLVGWLTLLMVLVTVLVVMLRYAFDMGFIWMQESITWMHAAVFMLGAAYTLRQDEHVRVDIFFREMSERRRALVGIVGTCIFLLPVCGFIGFSSWDYASNSWSMSEGSREAGGLPYPFVPLLKSLIPATAVLLGLQAVADMLRDVLVIMGRSHYDTGQRPPQGEVL
jgi:TRAP-type mannitol/chloroaromatic compound transport system permease small subunit